MKRIFIKKTPSFEKDANKLMSEEAREDLFDHLEAYPDSGDVIPGTGGIRKLRWETGKQNAGKRGGVRVLYHYSNDVLIILITLYAKTKLENISQKEKQQLKKLMPKLIEKYREDIPYENK